MDLAVLVNTLGKTCGFCVCDADFCLASASDLLSVLLSVFLGGVLGLGGVGGDARLADNLLGEDFGVFLADLASFARFFSCAWA